ncbi:Regulator of G-protein signaling 8 [Armadillidium vulgare]|nr:Regulator of G-protein signaling 8 [Armadillidium vulgare]
MGCMIICEHDLGLRILSGKKTPTPDKKREEPKTGPGSSVSLVKEAPKDKPKQESKRKTPTKLQLEKWTSSINALLADDEGVAAFEEFLEECETEPGENKKYLDFYKDCNEFRKKMYELEAEAQRIYETYLEVGSELEVGTRGKGEEVGKRIEEEGFPQKNLFDVTQQKVKEILDEGLYINFCQNLVEKYKI